MKTELQKTEEYLDAHYLNKFVKYSPVGKSEVYGKIDRICADTSQKPTKAIFIIDGLRYEEELDELLTILTLI